MEPAQIQDISSLSRFGIECLKLSRRELFNFKGLKSIKEISIEEAKKLGNYSAKVIFGLEMYTDEKATYKVKERVFEAIKKDYSYLVSYVRKFYKKCFEPRMVLLMCEVKMIEAGVIPAKIKEIEVNVEENAD